MNKRVASTFAAEEIAGYRVHFPQTSGFLAGNDGDESRWNHANRYIYLCNSKAIPI